MAHWKYKVETAHRYKLNLMLNKWGLLGWEVAAMTVWIGGYYTVVLKQEIPASEAPRI